MIFEIIFSFFIIAAAFYGLFLGGKIKEADHIRHLFEYYTNLSNILILVYQLLRLGTLVFPENNLTLYRFMQRSDVAFAAMNAIFMTFIIYHFVLRPHFTDKSRIHNLSNYCVHYIVPLSSVMFWLLFCGKDLHPSIIYKWLILPYSYYVYILGRAILGINIAGKDTPYPYFFIDRKKVGNKKFSIGVIGSMSGFLVLGIVTYLITLLFR